MQSAAIYVRVSTDEQIQFSPEAQKRALFDYAAKNNIYISDEHIYIDEGISGKKAKNRPQFQKMIATAKSKARPFELILVHKFDRFARSREDSIVYKSMLLRECGVKVISITEETGDDKTSVILEAMLEAMGEYYSLNLSEEVKKGMTIKAERGEIQTAPPLGYNIDKESKKLVINEAEAETVRYIFSETLALSNTGQIAKKLNLAGIKTKRGKMFDQRNLYYILNNPTYIGKLRWTPTGKMKWDFNNPDTLVVQSNHEPIISEEDFAGVKKIMASRKKIYYQYNTSPKYFLSGFVKCSSCGSNLTSAYKKGLQCTNYNSKKCFVSHYISIGKFERALKEKLEYDIHNFHKIKNIEIKEIRRKADNSDKSEKIDNQIDNQIKKANEKLERATVAYLNGIYDIEYLKKIKAEISEEIKEAERQKQSQENKKPVEIKEVAQEALKIFDENYSREERRRIAELTIEKIIYAKNDSALFLYYKQ